MRVTSKFAAISIVASVSCSVVAQGVTYDELAAHITKTNPTYQSIELQPKQAELRYKGATAENWQFSASSGFSNNNYNASNSRGESKYWRADFDLSRFSQSTGINFGLGYGYSRNRSAYQYDIYPESHSSSYGSNLNVSVNAPLWRNALGYVSRRDLQQSEIQLELNRLSYLSNRESFMLRTQQQFNSLCYLIESEVSIASAMQRATSFATAMRNNDGAADIRGIPHANRFESEFVVRSRAATRQRELMQSDLATEYEFPRLKSEMPECNLDQRHTYVTGHTEIDKLVMESRTTQMLNFNDRMLDLDKEIVNSYANPHLGLSASYRLNGTDDDRWSKSLNEDGRSYDINLNFSYPLGNTHARIQMDQVDLRRINSENNRREITLNTVADLRRQVLVLQGIESEIELHAQRIEFARAALSQEAKLFAEGHVDFAQYEDSIRKLLDAELSWLASKLQYQSTYINYLTISDNSLVGSTTAAMPNLNTRQTGMQPVTNVMSGTPPPAPISSQSVTVPPPVPMPPAPPPAPPAPPEAPPPPPPPPPPVPLPGGGGIGGGGMGGGM